MFLGTTTKLEWNIKSRCVLIYAIIETTEIPPNLHVLATTKSLGQTE